MDLQKYRNDERCICTIDYEELAYEITKAEKSQNLQLAIWGSRRTNGINSVGILEVQEEPIFQFEYKVRRLMSQFKQ
jgi:hypothetical protein